MFWIQQQRLEQIVDKAVTTVEYEGDSIDKAQIVSDAYDYMRDQLMGLITYTHLRYELVPGKGYKNKETGDYESREDIVANYFRPQRS